MTLSLDIRAPVVVLVADFNPSIFQTPWIAKHLFDRNEGDQMAMTEVLVLNGEVPVTLTFLEGVAIKVGPNRTELYALDAELETLTRVENILVKMLQRLPHTPLSAVGCNLNYIDDDPQNTVIGFFTTPEGFETEGVINVCQSGVQLQLEGSEVLNFSRALSQQDLRFSFNYHRAEVDSKKYFDFVPGIITKSLAHSKKLLKSLYSYDVQGVLGFVVGIEHKGDENVAQAAD